VRPDLLVFAKLDLWPELTLAAAARGVRVAMVAATVHPDSRRLRWPSHPVTRSAYAALAAVGAITADDAGRLARLGCVRDRITVTGDPRVDSALEAVDRVAPDDPLRRLTVPAATMVAGSTWADDEAVLLDSFVVLQREFPNARLIIVPHDPSPDRLAEVEAAVRARGLPEAERLSRHQAESTAPVILVDRVGVLARLYGSGAMAYVGGGWGHKGIHSVLEPAAWARPVVIGPHDRGSPDAELLARAGALIRLPARGDASPSLTRQWRAWLEHPVACLGAGSAARLALEAERGAAERSAEMLDVRGET
jgi:3-deoxy-D-manno-octulosonic-acid transferase